MSKKIFVLALSIVLLATSFPVKAQQPKKVPRVCYLGSIPSAESLKPFRERLRELGYIEGQNISMESRYWDGKVERLPGLAAELIGRNCDVIVTFETEAAEASKNASKTVPVVMAYSGDAVRLGIVADLARPGGNITGLTSINAELSGKRLELLKEVVPRLSRVALLWSPGNPNTEYLLKETESAASSLRVAIQSVQVKVPNDFEEAFQAAINKRAQALMLGGGGFFSSHQKRIVELAAKNPASRRVSQRSVC
jgi:putative ABC transport system substrate-binding protein